MGICSPPLDNINIEVAHLLMCSVPPPVAFEREILKHPVNRREALIEVVIHICILLRDLRPDFLALAYEPRLTLNS